MATNSLFWIMSQHRTQIDAALYFPHYYHDLNQKWLPGFSEPESATEKILG
jgi:hypothetical protein